MIELNDFETISKLLGYQFQIDLKAGTLEMRELVEKLFPVLGSTMP